MSESKRWVAVTEDGNGKIRFFYKWIDEREDSPWKNFIREVSSWKVEILALYREEDVVEHCQL